MRPALTCLPFGPRDNNYYKVQGVPRADESVCRASSFVWTHRNVQQHRLCVINAKKQRETMQVKDTQNTTNK